MFAYPLPACQPACLPACLPASLPACLPACLPVCLSACLKLITCPDSTLCHPYAQILLAVLETTKTPSSNLVFPYIAKMACRLDKYTDTITNFRAFREVIRHVDYHPATVEFRYLLLDQFNLRFDEERVGHQEDLLICTILDPRFKNFTFKGATPEMLKNARDFLAHSFRDNFLPKLRDDVEDVEEGPGGGPSSRSSGFAKDAKKAKVAACAAADFLDSDDESVDDDDEDMTPERAEDEPMLGVPVEIQIYLGLPMVTERDFDLLGWWKLHAHMFPNLARMARQFLALPASSAGVERLFSSASTIHGDLRKNTKESSIQNLLFVKQNY